jgi:hypothetical protein
MPSASTPAHVSKQKMIHLAGKTHQNKAVVFRADIILKDDRVKPGLFRPDP